MRTVRLMADYDCHPLWEASPGGVGNIDPVTLPISDALRRQLHAWARKYDATLNRDDPLQSGFATTSDEAAFQQEGLVLATRLQNELGSAFAIVLKPA